MKSTCMQKRRKGIIQYFKARRNTINKTAKTIWQITKIAILILLCIGTIDMFQRTNHDEEKMKLYQAIDLFNKIDDIAHQRLNEILAAGNPDNLTGEALFHELDDSFHNATNLNERFRAAKKLEEFIYHEHLLLEALGKVSPEKNQAFHEVDDAFRNIK